MTDLYIGLACISLASIILAFAGVVLARRFPHWISTGVLILLLAATAVFLRTDGDRLWLAAPLPVSCLIVAGNLALPAAALVCGVAYVRMPGGAVRRCVLLAPLLGMAVFYVVRPILGNSPKLGSHWTKDVCRQTSPNSCGAAAAATLLRSAGIDATETEMAALCLTRAAGTPMAGVYRGLKIKTAGSPRRPKPFHCDIDQLREILDSPVLLTVRLDPGADVKYQEQWGWAPGVRHSIVLFRFLPNDRIEVGDPDAGREVWSIASLRVLWHGDGIRLEERQ